MSYFDAHAAGWDLHPSHIERAEAIVEKIMAVLPLKPWMRAMEFGAGTGITAFLLKDYLKEIIMIDSSAEMVKKMNEKIASAAINNLKPLLLDLENDLYTGGKFDFIYSQMVLHHAADVEDIFSRFAELLNPGACLAVADLYLEDGSFHSPSFKGYKGFDPDSLGLILEKYKFSDIRHSQCYVIRRKEAEDKVKEFPLFLLTACRL